jgi:hypothetical protein
MLAYTVPCHRVFLHTWLYVIGGGTAGAEVSMLVVQWEVVLNNGQSSLNFPLLLPTAACCCLLA